MRLIAIALLCVVSVCGCSSLPVPRPPAGSTAAPSFTPHVPPTPPAVARESTALFVVECLAGIAFVGAVVVSFLLPAGGKLAAAAAAAAAAVGLSALVTRLSLWVVPWMAAALVAAAVVSVITLAVEVALRVKARKPTTVLAAMDDVPAAIADTVRSVEQVTMRSTTVKVAA